MASIEPFDVHVSEDQETNDLFNSFIDVTKDAAITNHDLNNFHEMEEKGGTLDEQHTCTVQKDQENEGIQSKEIDKKDDGNCNKNEEQKFERNGRKTEEQNKEETVQVKNDDQVISNDRDLPQEAEKHIGKRLSKAVDELSDLEKQLSLMISDSSKYGAQQNSASPVLETDADKAGVNDNSEEEKSSNSTDDKSQEVLSHFEGVVDVIATTGGHETGGETSDAEHNASDKEEPATTKTVGDGEEIKSAEITEQSKEDEAMKTGSEEDCPSEGDKEIPHSQSSSGGIQNGDVFSGAEKLNDDDVNSSDALASETYPENSTPDASCTISQKQGKEEDSCQKSEDIVVKCNSSSEKSTNNIREDKQDEGENGNPDSSLGDKSKESSSEELDSKLIRKDSSAPDIEILMTDESGISERKSLDSLDIDLDESNPIQPDSPALTDEGIDSDSKSDLGDEDDTFDTSGDFSFMSKSGHLDVDRNRTGSDSSTLSEQEFKRDLTDYKKNGNKEDTADQICMEGYLLKLGGSGLTPRNWRKRWFALRCDNCLYYYKHSKDKVPCGVIVLCNYSITKAPEFNRKYCFKLNKGGARSYHLCAASDDEMRKWMVSLMSAATEVASDGTSFQISEGNVHNVSIPALSIRDPECHGYLSKQGLNIKNWKRRYCVLKNGYLYYYSDMSNTTALGVAKLLGYKIKPGEKRGKHYCFYGSPPDESLRTFHFSAETENDRDRWMTRMEESIAKGNTSQNTQE